MSTPPPPPPPPPNDPFAPMDGDPFANGNTDLGDQASGLSQGAPNVAAKPGKSMAILAGLVLMLLFLLYNIFSGGDKENTEPTEEREVPQQTILPPPPPVAEPIAAAPPILTPPDIPQAPTVELIQPRDDGAEQEQRQARLRSSLLIGGGSGAGVGGGLFGGETTTAPTSSDPNSQFEANIVSANTKAVRVEATRIGDLRRTIAQGRMIQATTESAVNTELPAPLRAIVSRDIYGEAGTVPLIPKGSRLIGSYNTSIVGDQSRVYVVWTRVIRPDGVDVMLNSPLVDQIGQAGVGGQVDIKFQQIFSRAVMASVVSIGLAMGSDAITGGGETGTTNSTFGTTQSGDGATTATVNALNRLGSTTDSFLQRFINVSSTILVDQGTPVNVFVNRDLVFPEEVTGTRIVN